MIVTSCSRLLVSGVSDTSESLGHLAESTLLSHDVVSDDLSWSTSDLIIRLYFLVSVRHRHRCEEGCLARYEGGAQLLVHLQSLEVCTFEPLLSQVPADLPTNEPLPVPVHQSFKPALNHSAAVS